MTDDELEIECGKPCHPDRNCEECAGYWQRMQQEGYWVNGQWTDRAMKEMLK